MAQRNSYLDNVKAALHGEASKHYQGTKPHARKQRRLLKLFRYGLRAVHGS